MTFDSYVRCVMLTESEKDLLDSLLANYQVDILNNLTANISCSKHNPLDKLMEAAEKLKPIQDLRTRIKPE